MAFSDSKSLLLVLACMTLLCLISQHMVQADVHIGSCVWGAVDYTSNCLEECKRRGYKGGHCGSVFNVNCCDRKSLLLVLACMTLLCVISQHMVQADVHIGSCVWGAVDYTSNCLEECKRRGYKGGHCGSFANVNCWCEQ